MAWCATHQASRLGITDKRIDASQHGTGPARSVLALGSSLACITLIGYLEQLLRLPVARREEEVHGA